MKKNESLISGPIGSALLAFAVPLMLSSLVQQLYVTADAVIVGRIAGKTALAAIDSVHTLFRFPGTLGRRTGTACAPVCSQRSPWQWHLGSCAQWEGSC